MEVRHSPYVGTLPGLRCLRPGFFLPVIERFIESFGNFTYLAIVCENFANWRRELLLSTPPGCPPLSRRLRSAAANLLAARPRHGPASKRRCSGSTDRSDCLDHLYLDRLS